MGHITPEAAVGGPIALVEDGDEIPINGETLAIELSVSDDILAQRKQNLQPFKPKYTRGLLAKYAHCVSSASTGAVTDEFGE